MLLILEFWVITWTYFPNTFPIIALFLNSEFWAKNYNHLIITQKLLQPSAIFKCAYASLHLLILKFDSVSTYFL